MTDGNDSGVLIVNEIGWGNGVLELPFALALTQRFKRVAHSPSPFLAALGPRALGSEWCWYEADWSFDPTKIAVDLRRLIERTCVTHVVNFRNEDVGHTWNTAFAALRADVAAVEVWDLLDQYTGSNPFIQRRWTTMFRAHGLEPHWGAAERLVRSLRPATCPGRELVVCSGVSREDKAVRPAIWAEVIAAVCAQQPDLRIRLVHGRSDRERKLGLELEGLVHVRSLKATTVRPKNIEELAAELGGGAVVAANDSFPMHLAYALGRPTLGLFSVTERMTWGPPDGPRFRGRSSNACRACAGIMPAQGTCWEQDACPSPPNASWDPREIAGDLLDLVGDS